MTRSIGRFDARRWTVAVGLVAVLSLLLLAAALSVPTRASAAEAPVGLGTTATYSVLGGQAVTNTGPSVLNGDVGVSPGTAITGFPPGITGGTLHSADAAAGGAQSDLVIAYNDAAGRAPIATITGDLGGTTLTAGVYDSASTMGLTGTLTLDAQGDPNAVFIFQVGSALITASSSNVSMINGAQPCNVFWQVGSSATLGTGSNFVGSILALTSITVTTGTVVEGRALARNGQVSLDTNVFFAPGCDTVPTTTTTTTTTTTVPVTTTTSQNTGPANVVTTTGNGAFPRRRGGGTGLGGRGGFPPEDNYPFGPDYLANTGVNHRLPALLSVGAALLTFGGLLVVVTRDRRAPRKRPWTK
ncbi:ice-binding family protein [Actinophytocola sp.]|uniref:ice-binding family protein n=1 Tax=Actinophytocola sp. TaxID=1872138 RepID=UPI002D3EFEA9|nr:ice-binding family protein [Actinophytocola sp.]HYQ65014.1 ice-binding family protein [Actinophytocola sp.]